MKLKNILSLNEVDRSGDMDGVGPDQIVQIKKHIRKGASDPTIHWTNALELVQQSYDACDIERPTPAMHTAWKQYEDNITYAVQQLHRSTENGLRDDSWRSGVDVSSLKM